MNENKIQNNLFPLYDLYRQHKLLFEFYQIAKAMKNIDQVKDRIEYLKRNPKLKQKTELETLLWVLGEENIDV